MVLFVVLDHCAVVFLFSFLFISCDWLWLCTRRIFAIVARVASLLVLFTDSLFAGFVSHNFGLDVVNWVLFQHCDGTTVLSNELIG